MYSQFTMHGQKNIKLSGYCLPAPTLHTVRELNGIRLLNYTLHCVLFSFRNINCGKKCSYMKL